MVSDTQQAADWWLAMDGKWYPPAQPRPPTGTPVPGLAPPGPAATRYPKPLSPEEIAKRAANSAAAADRRAARKQTDARSSRKAWTWIGVAVAVVVLAIVGFKLLTPSISAPAHVTVLGAGCGDSAYTDMSQLVVKNPSGKEVGYADLEASDDTSEGYCEYSGKITIDDGSDYFLVSSRSQVRAPLRVTRAEIEAKGINVSVGDCADLVGSMAGVQCMKHELGVGD